MQKKKQMEIFKEGMQAGAAPFEKKFEETSKRIRETKGHMDQLARNQKKSKKLTDTVIEGAKQNHKEIQKLSQSAAKEEKITSKNQRKIQSIELMMPSASTTCEVCGKLMDTHQLVCSYCGAMSKTFPYELADFDIEKQCKGEVTELAKVIQDSGSIDEDWLYRELDEKFKRMKKIKKIAYQAMNNNVGYQDN